MGHYKSLSNLHRLTAIGDLVEKDFLTYREGLLICSMISNAVLKDVLNDAELLRGRLLRAVLVNLLRKEFEMGGK